MVKEEKQKEGEEKKTKRKRAASSAKAPLPKSEEAKAPEITTGEAALQKEEKKEAAQTPVEPKAVEPAKHEHKEPKARKRKGAPAKPKGKVFVARGKRKESVARATITEGKGVVRFNKVNVSSINNRFIREIINEPLRHVGPEVNSVDISVSVEGGGVMGQAQAARTAIANALTMYFDSMNLREKFTTIDRSLIIEDTRRVESKKFRGPKARARFQKSYR